MTHTESEPIVPPALSGRVKRILLSPREEWERIDAEPATIGGIYRNYLVYLAAIGPICRFAGTVVFNQAPVVGALVQAVVAYALSLGLIYVMALVIDALAPRFGGRSDRIQAFKVAAYSSTASMLAGAFALIPLIAWLAILGFYSLYLLWLGLPRLMRTPEDKAMGFFLVVLVIMLGLGILLSALMWNFVGLAYWRA